MGRGIAPQQRRRRRQPLPPCDDLLAQIGERVRLARCKRGLTQSAFPPLTRSAVSAIEKGRHAGSIRAYALIADTLGIPLRDLLPD